MTKIIGIQPPYGLTIRKKIGHYEDPLPYPWWGIYQMRKCKEGKIPVREKFYTPFNPQSPLQQENRGKFAAGVLAWQNLTPEQKEVYNKKSVGRGMSGYNLFLREYMLS